MRLLNLSRSSVYILKFLGFLQKLVKDEDYSKAAVWLQYGECLWETGYLDDAAIAYEKVVDLGK